MKQRRIATIGFFLWSAMNFSTAQNPFPQNLFQSPVPIRMMVAGSFGEPRDGHFHTGLDFTTAKTYGIPALAAADGYVSRVKVSAYGYGNAVYIAHASGYSTVYCHLEKFSPALAAWVKQQQNAKRSFEVDLFPSVNQFRFSQGDTVGLIGNSGQSSAVHLHFEIRDSKTETPLNPWLFGIIPPDSIPPRLTGCWIYPRSLCCGYGGKEFFPASQNHDTILVADELFGVGIECADTMANNNENSYGVYTLRIELDSDVVYSFQCQRAWFGDNHAAAEMDFCEKKNSGKLIYRCFRLPGDAAALEESNSTKGIITLMDDAVHLLRCITADANGNTTTATWFIRHIEKDVIDEYLMPDGIFLNHNAAKSVPGIGIQMEFPAGAVWDDLQMELKYNEGHSGIYSNDYFISPYCTPLAKSFKLKILPLNNLATSRVKKAVIVYRDANDIEHGKTTGIDGNYFWCNATGFGEYYVKVDEEAPSILAVNCTNGKSMAKEDFLRFEIDDNLSGIKTYRGTIDGEWKLFAYDAKTGWLTYEFEDAPSAQTHHVTITVADDVGNIRTLSMNFLR